MTTEQLRVKMKLYRYLEVKRERDQLEKVLQDLDSRIYAAAVPRYDGMPHGSGVGDPTGNAAAQRTALLDKYREKIAELDRIGETFEDYISGLTATERMLLRYRYICGLAWDRVADRMNYSLRNVFNLHRTCLEKLAAKEEETS